jgi:8-amino-7-oxononanoate synthase
MKSRLNWLDDELAKLDSAGLRRRLTARETAQGPRIRTGAHSAGRSAQTSRKLRLDTEAEPVESPSLLAQARELINFGSNDYLGLAADPRLADAARRAIDEEGWGAGASPLVTGRSAWHARLEDRLADFEGTEAALLFPSGFAANAGTVAALVDRGDVIFADQKNHASLIDGCRLSRAETFVYRHCDCAHLAELLRDHAGFRRRLIVTDTLFSMDGDFSPLVELAGLAEKYNAMFLVDEAHATGVFGKRGRGLREELGVEKCVDVRVGTLSKALGCSGGFVAGSRSLIDWLVNRARPYVFSTAQPAANAAAAVAALEIVESEPARRTQLLNRATRLREALTADGWNIGRSTSHIVPIYIGQPDRTMRLADALRQRGFFVPGIRPPSVPQGESMLRISVCHGHTDEMLDQLISVLRDLRAA